MALMYRFLNGFKTVLAWLVGKPSTEPELESNVNWCLVGNIVDEHPHGEQKERKRGSKHFSPGTKVYCLPPQWGDGYEKAVVVGLHRGSRKWVTVVMSTSQIANWRAKIVYKPVVLERLQNGFQGPRDGWRFKQQWKSREHVEDWVCQLNQERSERS